MVPCVARPALTDDGRHQGTLCCNLSAMQHATILVLLGASAVACGGGTPGYDANDPTKLTCGCHDGGACYAAAAATAERLGETGESAEELLSLSQCACFQGSRAGCNTLAHYAKDWVAACEGGKDVARSCAIAGFVHTHAVTVPQMSGKSWRRDATLARSAFTRACDAGSQIACKHK